MYMSEWESNPGCLISHKLKVNMYMSEWESNPGCFISHSGYQITTP